MTCEEARSAIRRGQPLLHCISNVVTANDCANLALAIGASPIMAQEPQEMADIVALASAEVLNMGTPSAEKFMAARLAGAAANSKGIPVVLDPVGVGASQWRLAHTRDLLRQVHPDIVRVNYSEAIALLEHHPGKEKDGQAPDFDALEHGVDSLISAPDAADCAKALAAQLDTVVLLSGEADYVTDGQTLYTVRGGSPLMRRVTGAGCMLSVLCGAFAAVEHDPLTAAHHAAAFWKSCATAAAAKATGSASFRIALLDTAGTL